MPSVRIFVASAGNDFMFDVAKILAAGLTAEAAACEIAVDKIPEATAPDEIQLVVAPHEFGPLFLAKLLDTPRLHQVLEQVFVVNVEQPGSAWFDLAFDFARRSRGVFDISREGAEEFRRRGLAAHHTPLGYVQFLELKPTVPVRERYIDVLFMGHGSRRREQFFARHAPVFSSFNCHLLLSDIREPRRTETPGYASGAARARLLGESKILVNVHSTDRRYFETHRALLALANRCLLITESSRYTHPLVNGQHFIMAPLDDIPQLCRRYLEDLEELDRVATCGYDFAKTDLNLTTTARTILKRTSADLAEPTKSEHVSRRAALDRLTRSRRQRAIDRKVDWDAVGNVPYDRSQPPTVTVLVTLYNYSRFISECLTSVIEADGIPGGIELVVVDDASTDDSVARVHGIMDAAELPVLLVKKHLNTGLADARNVGLESARAQYVFVLDADNWIYPPCLRVLHAAITEGAQAAVYGLIRRFDDETGESLGLMSTFEWNVQHLVRHPYIDAMAMFDRQILLDLGGYSTELIEHGWFGWEDYDVWLKLGQADHACKLIPRILSSYRVHAGSMIHQTNRSSEAIARYFRTKFAHLVGRYPNLDQYFGFPASNEIPQSAGSAATEAEELEGLRVRCHQLQEQLAAVYASKSWKLTGPLRFAFRLLSGEPRAKTSGSPK